jgi:hypothetical protein
MSALAEILAYLITVMAVAIPMCGHHNEPLPWKRKDPS